MLTTKDVTAILETLLSSPGMNDEVKVNFRASRKTILLLSKTIELGLSVKSEGDAGLLFAAAPEETMHDLTGFATEILKQSGLTDMYQKLQSLQIKQS